MDKLPINDEEIGILLANWDERGDELENSDDESPVNDDDEYSVDMI